MAITHLKRRHVAPREGCDPRDEEGRFTGAGAKVYRQNAEYAEIMAGQKAPPSLDEILGEGFKGYKGQDAVNKLLQEKHGHIKSAFHRDDIGDIDLLWGNDKLGLQHIIKQREEEKQEHSQEIMEHLVDAIEKGEFKQKNDRGNFVFSYRESEVQYRAIIAPEYHNHKITYVLTDFRRGKRR